MTPKTMESKRSPILPLGTVTREGTIKMVGCLSGERYYWLIDDHKVVKMMPAEYVEEIA